MQNQILNEKLKEIVVQTKVKVLIKKIKSDNQFREYKSSLIPFYNIDFEGNWTAKIMNANVVLFKLNRKNTLSQILLNT